MRLAPNDRQRQVPEGFGIGRIGIWQDGAKEDSGLSSDGREARSSLRGSAMTMLAQAVRQGALCDNIRKQRRWTEVGLLVWCLSCLSGNFEVCPGTGVLRQVRLGRHSGGLPQLGGLGNHSNAFLD